MTTRQNTTIRLSPQERREMVDLMKQYGFTQLAPFIRYAIKQLRPDRK